MSRLTRSLFTASAGAAMAAVLLAPTLPDVNGTDLVTGAGSKQVERPRELLAARREQQVKHQGAYPVTSEAYATAVAQAAVLPASRTYGDSVWQPLGVDALNADSPAYGVKDNGFHNLSGRIQSFARDPENANHWYAAVANGGVYTTNDAGQTWSSIGDELPSQIINAIDIADGRTLVVGSGDPAFGGDSYSGLGAFWSSDEGASWHHASGIPNGTITFRVAVDPTNDQIVYQATGKGLWRSTDAGRSYRNVVLPTTCTADIPGCFFANIVTDVVVRPAGNGKPGGAVLAAVGWRAGTKANAAGKPQAPRDGIYTSPDGAPGTFSFVQSSGLPGAFPTVDRAGRTALGLATGPTQNHDYVYALVQDPKRFNDQAGIGDFPVEPISKTPLGGTLNPSTLNGLYGSKDFGQTWTLMANADQLDLPGRDSNLEGIKCTLGYCAGVQSWYNEWVQPSPATSQTRADGSPMYLAFGLEEVWGGDAAIPLVPNTSQFKVFGSYYTNDTSHSTVHPDQHAVMFVPDGDKATIVIGNDGGAYKQAQQRVGTDAYDNVHWGEGINHGLHTLLPYDATMSRDGTVWAGLQDNGQLKISPDGTQDMAYGGDAFFSAVDPDNSDVAYEEYTYGDIAVTTNGGKGWRDIFPCYDAGGFSTPFLLDPTDSDHLVAAGSVIEESTFGPKTTSPRGIGLTEADRLAMCDPKSAALFASDTDWVPVFDLGETSGHRNVASAVDTRGDSTYAGFCGACDIVTEGTPFHAGLATNVGGDKPAKRMTGDGWHVATANGLPQRVINSVTLDPADPKTVYVTLGGYGRRWIPPGALADDTSKVGTGNVFVSRDAGEHFTDISGNLPDLAANWALLHDGDLIVANDLGVYSVSDVAHAGAGASYAKVGTGLPAVPVVHLQITPRSKDEVLAATYGRGVQVIKLKPGTVPKGSTSGTPPRGRIAATGLSTRLAALALLLLLAALLVRRRTQV